jgi:hypothetical protein
MLLGDTTGFTGRAVEANFSRRYFQICFIPSHYHKCGNYAIFFCGARYSPQCCDRWLCQVGGPSSYIYL